jgi:hypothetical protein
MTGSLAISCANSAHMHRQTRSLRRVEPVASAGGGEEHRQRDSQTAHARGVAPAAQPLSSVAAQILGARHAGAPATGYEAYAKAAKLLQLESTRIDVCGL